MSKVKQFYEDNRENRSNRRPCGRMPVSDGKKGRKKKQEAQIDGQMELIPDENNELIAVLPANKRTRETQKLWNKAAKDYYNAFNEMIDAYGAYLQLLRPWQDLKKNGLKKASSGSLGLLSDYFKDDYTKMTDTVVKRKDELYKKISEFSRHAKKFGIDYPTGQVDQRLGEPLIRQKYRGYINTRVSELNRESAALDNPFLDFIPEKAITKVLSPDDMKKKSQPKYSYHKR